MGNLALEALDDERDPFIHEIVQVRGDPRHLHHHANLQPDNKFFSVHVQLNLTNTIFFFFTYRKPVVHHSMAMVAAISPGCIQAYNDLVPPLSFTQVLWEAR